MATDRTQPRSVLRVDDLIITGSMGLKIKQLKEEMEVIFKMSDLGPPIFYLRIKVCQSTTDILQN